MRRKMGTSNRRSREAWDRRRRAGLRRLCALVVGAIALTAGEDRAEGEILPGPVEARVLRVVDGDTIEVAARIWLDQELTVLVRLDGVDTPELKGRCARERELARAARDLVAAAAGATVRLSRIQYDKYGRRVVARVAGTDGRDLSAALIDAGLAHGYAGGRKLPWCEAAAR
jgi:endonuclease YncB( thermonuclease family)